jgi:hypothetical protein
MVRDIYALSSRSGFQEAGAIGNSGSERGQGIKETGRKWCQRGAHGRDKAEGEWKG